VAEELDGGGGYSAGSVYLGVGLDLDQIDKDALAIPAKVQAIKDIRIPVKLCADEDHFRRSVDDLRRIKIDCISVPFCLDEESFYRDIRQAHRYAADYYAKNPIKVGFDTSAKSFVRAEIESLRRETVDLKGSFSFDTASVRAELESVRSLADEIAATPRSIYYAAEVSLNDTAAIAKLDALKTTLDKVINVDVQTKISIESNRLDSAIARQNGIFANNLEKILKEANKESLLGKIGSVLTAPVRAIGASFTQVVKGALVAVGEATVKPFERAIGQKAKPITELVGKQSENVLKTGTVALARFSGYESTSKFRAETFEKLESLTDFSPRKVLKATKKFEDSLVSALESLFIDNDSEAALSKVKVYTKEIIEAPIRSLVELAGVGVRIGAQPFRIRKRVELSNTIKEAELLVDEVLSGLSDELKRQIKSAKGVTLSTGGIDFQKVGENTYFSANLARKLTPGNVTIPVPNAYSNDVETLGPLFKARQAIFPGKAQPVDRLLQTALETGRNPDAAQLLARVLAIRKIAPDKPITITGSSGGAALVEEVIGAAERAAIKNVKGVGLTLPGFDLTRTASKKNYQTLVGTYDPIAVGAFGKRFDDQSRYFQKAIAATPIDTTGLLSPGGATTVFPGLGTGHHLADFLADKKVQSRFTQFTGTGEIDPGYTGNRKNFEFANKLYSESQSIPRTIGVILGDLKALKEVAKGQYSFIDPGHPEYRRDNDFAAMTQNFEKLKVQGADLPEYERFITFLHDFKKELTNFYEVGALSEGVIPKSLKDTAKRGQEFFDFREGAYQPEFIRPQEIDLRPKVEAKEIVLEKANQGIEVVKSTLEALAPVADLASKAVGLVKDELGNIASKRLDSKIQELRGEGSPRALGAGGGLAVRGESLKASITPKEIGQIAARDIAVTGQAFAAAGEKVIRFADGTVKAGKAARDFFLGLRSEGRSLKDLGDAVIEVSADLVYEFEEIGSLAPKEIKALSAQILQLKSAIDTVDSDPLMLPSGELREQQKNAEQLVIAIHNLSDAFESAQASALDISSNQGGIYDISKLEKALKVVQELEKALAQTRYVEKLSFPQGSSELIPQVRAIQQPIGRLKRGAYEGILSQLPKAKEAADAGDDTAKGFIQSLTKALPTIEKTANATGQVFIDQIKKTLGIASPSKVMIAIGQNLMESLPIGVRNNLAAVASAAIIAKDTFFKNFIPKDIEIAPRYKAPRPPDLRRLDQLVVTNRPKFMEENKLPYFQALVRQNPPNLQSQYRADKDLATSLNQVVRQNPPDFSLIAAQQKRTEPLRPTYKNDDLSQFYAGSLRPRKLAPELDDRTAQQKAFQSGQKVGDAIGYGLKESGKFVDRTAKDLIDKIPGPIKEKVQTLPDAFKGFFSGLKTQFDQARADLPLFDKIAGGIKGVAIAAGAGFIGVSIFQQIQSQAGEAYQAVKQLESARTIVKATTGNTKALDLANVQADRRGARLDESRTAIKGLTIQAQNTPLEGKVGEIFKGAATSATALQLNKEEQGRLYLAEKQVLGKGTVQSEELKQQLGELGISFQLAARSVGLTTTEFEKQLSQGAVLSTDFLPKFARQQILEQGGLALKAADTPQGLENKLSNSKLLLQEAVGEQSLPLITAGMKALNGILELVTNNIGVLTTAINVGLIAALAKGASVIKEYAFTGQFRRNISLDGTVNEKVSIGSRAGRAVTGAADFVKGGGIQRALTSEPAKEIAKAAGEALLFAGALASVSKVSETIFGGKDLQDYNKQLEITRIRLEEINKVYDKTDSSIKNFGDRSRTAGNEALAVLGNLAKLDFGGAIDSFSRGLVAIDGGDPNATFGRNESQFGLTTRQQADNSRILLSGLDTINSGKFNDEFAKGSTLATKLRKGLQVVDKTNAEIEKDPALNDKLKKGLIVSQEDLSNSRESLQTYREQLASIPEAILKSPEGQPLREEIKQLDKLIKNLGGEGSAYAKLTVAAQKYADITQKQIELEKTQAALISSRGRASGQTTEFQSKLDDIAAQSDAAAKNKAAIADLLQKSDAFLAGSEFSALRLQDPLKAQAKQQENIEYKTQYAAADKQIEDGITQVRLENVNRRSELFQREVAEQERLTARREGRQRLATTGRDANLALGASRFEITPQQLRIRQIQAQEDDATFAFREGYKKRADAVKNLRQAQFDLSRINPNDEQQYEAGKAAVAQYQQAVLAAGAEINAQQKAYSDAQLARIQEEQSQVSTLIDQTVRKAEQQADRRIKANDRLTAALKRQTDNQVAGLERVNKLVGKQNELTQAQANLAQIRGGGRLSGLKAAGDLAQQVKDLDPNKKEETAQDREKKRDRLGNILDRIGLGRDPERIFQKEVTAANDLAKVKARALSAEIRGAEITLAIEQRKEKIARERAVREALAAQRSAQLGVDRSSVGVRAAEARLNLAKLSGDPNKVIEAQLTLDQAKLDFEAAASELPNSANAVNEALFDLANSIRESALQRELGQVSAETKRSQFGLEERDRVTSTQVEAANKGFNFGRTRVQDQSGLVPLRGITLRNDPIYRSGVKESRFEAAEERSIARQRPESLQFNDRANSIKTFASYGLNLRPGESLGNLAKFNGVGAPSVAPPDLSRLLQTPSFSASTPTQNEQVTFDPSGQIVEALNRQLQIAQAMNAKLAGLLQKELTATVQVNGISGNDDVQIRGGR
jgi:tape measure domain-containing protein